MDKKKAFRYVMLCLAGGVMILIFVFSSQTASVSRNVSAFFTEHIFSAWGLTERFVRKLAHFTEFAVLGAFAMLFISTFDIKRFACALISLTLCAAYAAADEFHQLFVRGRSGQISDVLLDICGAVLGVLVVYLTLYFISRKHS